MMILTSGFDMFSGKITVINSLIVLNCDDPIFYFKNKSCSKIKYQRKSRLFGTKRIRNKTDEVFIKIVINSKTKRNMFIRTSYFFEAKQFPIE